MMVVGSMPFNESNPNTAVFLILDVKYSVPDHVSPECKHLIGRMLVRYPVRHHVCLAMLFSMNL